MKILLTEDNILDIYTRLRNKENITPEELEQVRRRFYELVDYAI